MMEKMFVISPTYHMVSNAQIILYSRMVTNYAGGYAFSYEYGQFSILKIQIHILLDPCAHLDLNYSVSGTHDTKTWCRSDYSVGLGVIPRRCLGSVVDNVPGI